MFELNTREQFFRTIPLVGKKGTLRKRHEWGHKGSPSKTQVLSTIKINKYKEVRLLHFRLWCCLRYYFSKHFWWILVTVILSILLTAIYSSTKRRRIKALPQPCTLSYPAEKTLTNHSNFHCALWPNLKCADCLHEANSPRFLRVYLSSRK